MDNDNKIIQPSEFLPDIIEEDQNVNKLYDLSEEFEKTKHNKSSFTLIVIILFISGLTGIAWGLTHFIEKYNENLSIDINDFEDINLVDLLNATKKYENDLNLINQEIENIRENQKKEIDTIRKETDQKITTLETTETNQRKKEETRALYIREREKKEQNILAKYQTTILKKEQERNLVLARIESYDKRQLEKAKKSEEVLQNQQKLHDIELQKTVTEYETKIATLQKQYQTEIYNLNRKHTRETAHLIATYNPVVTDATLDSVLQINNELPGNDLYIQFSKLSTDAPELKQPLQTNAEKLHQFDMMYDKLKATPYINSVPALLKGSEFSVKYIISDFLNITQNLAEEIKQQKQTIKEDTIMQTAYYKAVQKLARTNGDMGLIINADNPQSVLFYYNDILALKQGTLVTIFRNDNEYIGTMQLFRYKDSFRGNVTELKSDAIIQPLDRLLFDLKRPVPSESDTTSDIRENNL